MADSDLEDGVQLPFNPDEWIGCGKTLPTSVARIPQGLIDHFNACQQIPDTIKALYPLDSLRVLDFISFNLPKGTFDLTNLKPQMMFKKVQPNVDGTCLRTQRLPTLKCTEALHDGFRQAVLDGVKSVEDPRYPGMLLPLWSVAFWKHMWRLRQAQEDWRSAKDWLEKHRALTVLKKLKGKGTESDLDEDMDIE